MNLLKQELSKLRNENAEPFCECPEFGLARFDFGAAAGAESAAKQTRRNGRRSHHD
jgi:hypothetical protein